MNNITYNFFFDYIYYRIKKKFYRRDHNGIFALLVLSLVQFYFVTSIIGFIVKLFYSRAEIAKYPNVSVFLVLSYFVLAYYNNKKFDKNYWKYWEHWKDESKSQKTLKGWLVFLVLIITTILFYLVVAM